jgi:hypothetical protein
VSEKEDRPTKRIFKDFARSQHTRGNKQTSHYEMPIKLIWKNFKPQFSTFKLAAT